jgi:hypothetical protein
MTTERPRGGEEESVLQGLDRRGRRVGKLARRALLNALGGRPDTRVVFIMGAQRSGTRVPLVALESSPDILTFREGARQYFRGSALRPDEELERLFDACPFPVLVLKPLCESHRALELLDRFPQSKVIWIFRSYQDAVHSASVKWSSGVQAVEQLVAGSLPPGSWRLGGLTAEALDTARRLHRPGLSLHHANAILWYLRNRLILDLDITAQARALLVKYEDLSTEPHRHFPRVFRFVGEPLKPGYLKAIYGGSVRLRALQAVPDDVLEACQRLHGEIDRRYALACEKGPL